MTVAYPCGNASAVEAESVYLWIGVGLVGRYLLTGVSYELAGYLLDRCIYVQHQLCPVLVTADLDHWTIDADSCIYLLSSYL